MYYSIWFDLYGTREELQAIVAAELEGQDYFLMSGTFERNGMQVARVYLTTTENQIRLASKYFDASNRCQRCDSFDVFVHHQWMTTVYCNGCGLNRKYRPHAPLGRDDSSGYESETYDLKHSREIAYADTKSKYPTILQVVGHYDLWRHVRTGLIYRPSDNRAIWRSGKAMFEHSDGVTTRTVWLRQTDVEFYAINQPIYG